MCGEDWQGNVIRNGSVARLDALPDAPTYASLGWPNQPFDALPSHDFQCDVRRSTKTIFYLEITRL